MSDLDKQSPEAVKKALVYLIAADLERSIANLGYPVGCGVGPHPDLCAQAAERMVDKIASAALAILATRETVA
jgi:hypothetical protein